MNKYQLNRILSTDGLDKAGISILQENGIDVVEKKYLKKELINVLSEFDAVIVRSATTIDEDIINKVCDIDESKLKVIARAGTGVDNIDMESATRRGLLVINTPAANTLSAAEHTCALICSLSRKIPQAYLSMQNGFWDRKSYMGSELNGKTLAIIGLGRIGREVASRMQAFGMTVVGYDPIIDANMAKLFNVSWVAIDALWPIADYITIHVPLMKQTENLINNDTLLKCKKGVRIINCSRGGIVHEDDLLLALNSGQCAGAALDVFIEEPPTKSDLIKHPNLICTPHLGASTVEAQYRVAKEIAENIVALSNGSGIFGSVNGQLLQVDQTENGNAFKIFLKNLGNLFCKSTNVEVYYCKEPDTISAAVYENYIRNVTALHILNVEFNGRYNLINSSLLAKEKNLNISISKMESKESDKALFWMKHKENTLKFSIWQGRCYLVAFNDIELRQPLLTENGFRLIVSTRQRTTASILNDVEWTKDIIAFTNDGKMFACMKRDKSNLCPYHDVDFDELL